MEWWLHIMVYLYVIVDRAAEHMLSGNFNPGAVLDASQVIFK